MLHATSERPGFPHRSGLSIFYTAERWQLKSGFLILLDVPTENVDNMTISIFLNQETRFSDDGYRRLVPIGGLVSI
jgi:hypothetical protein